MSKLRLQGSSLRRRLLWTKKSGPQDTYAIGPPKCTGDRQRASNASIDCPKYNPPYEGEDEEERKKKNSVYQSPLGSQMVCIWKNHQGICDEICIFAALGRFEIYECHKERATKWPPLAPSQIADPSSLRTPTDYPKEVERLKSCHGKESQERTKKAEKLAKASQDVSAEGSSNPKKCKVKAS